MMECEERDRFVRELADALTILVTDQEWRADIENDGVFARLVGPEGRRITLHFYGGGRVEFSGSYPRSPYNGEEFGLGYGETHRIGCSVSRGPLPVAKDVQRRFLPHYEEVWHSGCERLHLHLEQAKMAKEALERLEEAWRVDGKWNERQPHAGSLRLYRETHGCWADVGLTIFNDGPSVNLEIHSLPLEHAAQVGLLLHEMVAAERGEVLPVDDGRDGIAEVLDGTVDAALAALDDNLYDPQPHVDGYTRTDMLDGVRDLLRGLVLTGFELGAADREVDGVE